MRSRAARRLPRLDVAAHADSGTVLALPMRDVLLQLQLRLLPAVPGRRDAVSRVLHVTSAVVLPGLL